MVFDKTSVLLKEKGFQYIPSNYVSVALCIKQSSPDSLDICVLIDNVNGTPLTPADTDSLNVKLEQKFLFNGFRHLNILYMIFTDHVTRDKQFLCQTHSFWLIDTLGKRIMVFEGQPDDFCHLKSDLENLFFSKTLEKQYFFRHFPFVTALLILTNVLVFIYVDANGSTENSFNMLRSGAAYWKYIFEDGEYSRLFTCIFLHFDAEHLLNNMITLGFIGTASERKFGHIGFSFIYFVSGLFASLASAFYYMNHDTGIIVISAGASGAIFGILGALVVYLIFTRNIRQNLSPAYLLIIMLLSVSNVFSDPAVDNIGHMGGIVCGIILGFISCFCRRKRLK